MTHSICPDLRQKQTFISGIKIFPFLHLQLHTFPFLTIFVKSFGGFLSGILQVNFAMEKAVLLHLICGVLAVLGVYVVKADDPYRYYTWTVTYGTLSPLGVPQQVRHFVHFCTMPSDLDI